jgi:hypothetical protein
MRPLIACVFVVFLATLGCSSSSPSSSEIDPTKKGTPTEPTGKSGDELTRKPQEDEHPLEVLPDPGEPKAKGTTTVSSRVSLKPATKRVVPTTDLPARLITRLGKTIRVGELEVTPQKGRTEATDLQSTRSRSDPRRPSRGRIAGSVPRFQECLQEHPVSPHRFGLRLFLA